MAIGKDRAVLRQLRTLFNVGTIRDLTDGQLLERFATGRGEAAELAFAVLVERHGPMVLRVCRGVLADPHDTRGCLSGHLPGPGQEGPGSLGAGFSGSLASSGGLPHRVVCPVDGRPAAPARTSCGDVEARRAAHEAGDELGRVLHEEIDRLPERYRAPLVLCDLEGRTHEQAARHLGWPVGTVKSRQARGRERLRDRLRRRGLAPNAGLLATALQADGPMALISPALVDSTARAVVQFVTVRTIVPRVRRVTRPGSSQIHVNDPMVESRFGSARRSARRLRGAGLLAQKGKAGDRAPTAGKSPGRPRVRRAGLRGQARQADRHRGRARASWSRLGTRTSTAWSRARRPSSRSCPRGRGSRRARSSASSTRPRSRTSSSTRGSPIESAEAAYQNAKLAREVAEIAVSEYIEGIYKQSRMP